MKAVSILLKIIAIIAAAAALYFVYTKNKQLNNSIVTFNQTLAPHAGTDEAVSNPATVVTALEKGKSDSKSLAQAKEDITSLNSANNGLNKQMDQIKKESKATENQLRKLRISHSEVSSKLNSTKDKLNNLDKKHADLSKKYASINAEYSKYRSQNKTSDLELKIKDLMQQLKDKEDALKRAIQRAGGEIVEDVEIAAKNAEEKVVRAKLVEGVETEVLKFDWKNNFIALDKGSDAGVKQGEEIYIYDNNGNLACVVYTEIVNDGITVGSFSKNMGDSPSIFVANKYIIKAKK